MSEPSDYAVLVELAERLRGIARWETKLDLLFEAGRIERFAVACERAARLVNYSDELDAIPDTRARLWSANDYFGDDEYVVLDCGEQDRNQAEELAIEGWEARGCPEDDPPTVNEYALIAMHVVEVEADGE